MGVAETLVIPGGTVLDREDNLETLFGDARQSPRGSRLIHFQTFPSTYPGDMVAERRHIDRGGSIETLLSDATIARTQELVDRGIECCRLLVFGRDAMASQLARSRVVYARVHEAGERVSVLEYEEVALELARLAMREDPRWFRLQALSRQYQEGAVRGIPRHAHWSLSQPGDHPCTYELMSMAVMCYGDDVSIEHGGVSTFYSAHLDARAISPELRAWDGFWTDMTKRAKPLFGGD